MTEVRGQLGDPGVDIDPLAVGVDQAVDRKGVPKVVQARGRVARPGGQGAVVGDPAEEAPGHVRAQPAAPSAGCIFKNPITIPAGKLIDELGLKGARVGGAFVSAEHGNFIVTEASATAQDVLALIDLLKRKVRTERGLDLETEVEIIGQ